MEATTSLHSPQMSPTSTILPSQISSSTHEIANTLWPTPSSGPQPRNTVPPIAPKLDSDATSTPNPILIARGTTAGDGADEAYICLFWRYPNWSLVIYTDGRLIMHTSEGLVEKRLSQQEIQSIFSQIDQTGFFDQRESIYDNLPEAYAEGGPGEVLQVKDSTLWINGALRDYLIQPVSDTLEILDEIEVNETEFYTPQELWMMIVDITDLESLDYYATPIPPTLIWPPELSILSSDFMVEFHIESGENVATMIEMFDRLPSGRVFTQNEKSYYVVACPVLP